MDIECSALSVNVPVLLGSKNEHEISMENSPTKRIRIRVRHRDGDRPNRTSDSRHRYLSKTLVDMVAISDTSKSDSLALSPGLGPDLDVLIASEVSMNFVDRDRDRDDSNDDSIENIRRIFGLYSDNMSLPLSRAELLAVNHIKASPFPLYEECRANKLPLLQSILAEIGEIMELGDNSLNSDQRCAVTELKMAYYTRKFEINNMTFSVSKCDSCGCLKQKQGVFMVPPVDPNARVNGNTKHIWKLLSPPSEAGKFEYFTDNEVRRRDPNGQLMIKVALCKSCINDLSKNAKKQPKFSERSGYSLGSDIPLVLSCLTMAEQAIISPIQMAINLVMMPSGRGTAAKGIAISVPRTSSVVELVRLLPRPAADLEIIVLKRQCKTTGVVVGNDGSAASTIKWRELLCRRLNIVNALQELMSGRYPAFSDIIMRADTDPVWATIPTNDYIVPHVAITTEEIYDGLKNSVDLGPAPGQLGKDGITVPLVSKETGAKSVSPTENEDDEVIVDHHGLLEDSGAPTNLANQFLKDRDDMRARMTNSNASIANNYENINAPFPPVLEIRQPHGNEFINPETEIYFWAKAFPTLFMPTQVHYQGQIYYDYPSDFHRRLPRADDATFAEWSKWIINRDLRFSAHPTLPFVMLSHKNKQSVANSTSFGVSTMDDISGLNKGELRDLIAGKPSVLAKTTARITSWSHTTTGTTPYWWEFKQNVSAWIDEQLFFKNQLPALFHTTSMAEFHEQALWHLLKNIFEISPHERYRLPACEELALGNACPSAHSKLLHAIVEQSTLYISGYGALKNDAWFELVLKQLGVEDWVRRNEFAASRGQFHTHSISFIPQVSLKVHSCLDRLVNCRSIAESELLENEVANDVCLAAKEILTEISCLHPAGRQLTNIDGSNSTSMSVVSDSPDMLATNDGTVWSRARILVATSGVTDQNDKQPDYMREIQAGYMRIGPTDVDYSLIGNYHRWPAHEGTAPVATSECLRKNLYQILPLNRHTHSINIVNRTMLHCCSAYCLECPVDTKPSKAKVNPFAVPITLAVEPTLTPAAALEIIKKWVCRMGYGSENKLVAARTDGKPACDHNRLIHVKGRTQLALERDHPRLVQGILLWLEAYHANTDAQLILAPLHDIPDLEIGETIFQWIETFQTTFNALSKEHQTNWAELFAARSYMDKATLAEYLEEYVASYCCKSEKSPKDAQKMLAAILNDALIGDDVSLKSIGLKVNNSLLRSRTMSKQETVFILSGNYPLHKCSSNFMKASLNANHHIVDDKKPTEKKAPGPAKEAHQQEHWQEDGGTGGLTKDNTIDKYLKQQAYIFDPLLTLDLFIRAGRNNVSINYSGGHQKAVWPLSEDYCKTMLMLFKPVSIARDWKGAYDTFVGSFTAFMNDASILKPIGIQQAIQRAARVAIITKGSHVINKTATRTGSMIGNVWRTGQSHGGNVMDDAYKASAPDEDLELFKESTMLFNEENNNDDEVVEGDESQFNIAAIGFISNVDIGSLPEFTVLAKFTASAASDFYEQAKKETVLCLAKDTNGRFYDPIMTVNNLGQRYVLCKYLQFLRASLAFDETKIGAQPLMRAKMIGIAGAGKSVIIRILESLTRVLYADNDAARTFAPTGAAAGAAGGSCIDRPLSFNRTSKTFQPITNKQLLVDKHKEFHSTRLIMQDEMSMVGKTMAGHIAGRGKELFNDGLCGDQSMGGVSASILIGDHIQLGPVLDSFIFKGGLESTLKNSGKQEYDNHQQCFELLQSVRQSAGGRFIQELTKCRDGSVSEPGNIQQSLAYWQQFTWIGMDANKRSGFHMMQPDMCIITMFNRDKHKYNHQYICYQQNLRKIKCISVGKHCTGINHAKLGQAKGISLSIALTEGMMVKLTTNVCPELGLFNNARGTVITIVYSPVTIETISNQFMRFGGYPGPVNNSASCVVIVDFPDFKGPRLSSTTPLTWVAVAAITLRCGSDAKCCSRTGIPLSVSKADSAHCHQGATIGDSKPIKKALFVWDGKAESMWPNGFYVGNSRAAEEHNLAMQNSMTEAALEKVGSLPTWRAVALETKRISASAAIDRDADFSKGVGGTRTLIEESNWFIAHVNEKLLSSSLLCAEKKVTIRAYVEQWQLSLAQLDSHQIRTASEEALADDLHVTSVVAAKEFFANVNPNDFNGSILGKVPKTSKALAGSLPPATVIGTGFAALSAAATARASILPLVVVYDWQLEQSDINLVLQMHSQNAMVDNGYNIVPELSYVPGCSISQFDLYCYRGQRWLSGVGLSCYLQSQARLQPEMEPQCVVLDATFFHVLRGDFNLTGIENGQNYAGVQRYTDHLDAEYLTRDIIAPVHQPGHWICVILSFNKQELYLVDPYWKDYPVVVRYFQMWYQHEYQRCYGELPLTGGAYDIFNWRVISGVNLPTSLPKQSNGWDCGVFVGVYLSHWMKYRQLPLREYFKESQAPEMRKWMVYCIIIANSSIDRGDINAYDAGRLRGINRADQIYGQAPSIPDVTSLVSPS